MIIWFMFDNHTFARVGDGNSSRQQLLDKAEELFGRDKYGTVFVRDSADREIGHAHKLKELPALLDKVEEHINWEAR